MKRKVEAAGYRILIKLKPLDDRSLEKVSAGGIITEVRDKKKLSAEQESMTEAYVVHMGETAFKSFDDGKAWCKVGDCILTNRYSGILVENVDDDEESVHRIINDQDVIAVFPKDGVQ